VVAAGGGGEGVPGGGEAVGGEGARTILAFKGILLEQKETAQGERTAFPRVGAVGLEGEGVGASLALADLLAGEQDVGVVADELVAAVHGGAGVAFGGGDDRGLLLEGGEPAGLGGVGGSGGLGAAGEVGGGRDVVRRGAEAERGAGVGGACAKQGDGKNAEGTLMGMHG